ncbi:MAG TPA: 50S ribosomal protein L9 [Negativicutes bacterium]|nr:50S ribosomal protein L9 [Negativicutes bacterium]
MKVILLQDVENVGKKYEIKEVKDGYARNFLLPQNLVKLANKENLQWLKGQKEAAKLEVEEDLKQAQQLASQIDGLEVSMPMKITETGQLFEAVNAQKIAEKLKAMGFDVKKSQIKLEHPIKETGEFQVKVNLDHNLEIELQLIISEGVPLEEKAEEA